MTVPNSLKDESGEIRALIKLLEDPDPFVQQHVRHRLNELGEKALPILDALRQGESDPESRQRLNRMVHDLSTSHVELEMAERISLGIENLADLENAMFTLSRFEDPLMDVQPFRAYMDTLASRAYQRIQAFELERDRVEAFMDFMFKQVGFSGKLEDYHAPQNSFLHHTLEGKKGLPLTLAMVMLFVARRADLALHGMNMPIHFMMLYRMERETLFIDPFGEGQLATYDQCYYFLKQNGVTPRADHFRPAKPIDMFSRALRNLNFSYQKSQMPEKASQMQSLLAMVELDPNKVFN
jgi:regulator of sirC expression with transglutaminase-like and TPR domain